MQRSASVSQKFPSNFKKMDSPLQIKTPPGCGSQAQGVAGGPCTRSVFKVKEQHTFQGGARREGGSVI